MRPDQPRGRSSARHLRHFYIGEPRPASNSYGLSAKYWTVSPVRRRRTMSLLRPTFRAPEDLRREIGRLDVVTGEIVSAVLDCALAHCAAPNRAEQARRIRELIGSKAWTEAALAIVALVRSQAVRRL